MKYYCDSMRHLVCVPYSVENLHEMAAWFGIDRCWYHSSATYKHYDIPKRRFKAIAAKCEIVSPRRILEIVKTGK